MRKHKITIVYKSGAVVKLRCENFSVRRDANTGEITSLEWKNPVPRPLHAGVDEITAVFTT